MYVKMVLESKACSPIIQILRKYPVFCCLPFFTYFKTIIKTLPFYKYQPALSISGCHFVIADWFKVAVAMWPPTAKSLLQSRISFHSCEWAWRWTLGWWACTFVETMMTSLFTVCFNSFSLQLYFREQSHDKKSL